MAGCYGNDPEDKYFENKLLNYTDGEEMQEDQKWEDLEPEVIEKITNFMNDNKIDDEVFQILDDLVLPVLDVLIENDVITANHLRQHLEQLDKYQDKMNEIRAYAEDVLQSGDKIDMLTREE